MYTGVHNTRINNLPSERHPHDDVTTTPRTSRRLLGEAPRRGGPPARQGAELRAKANQNHGRPEHGVSLACGRRRPRGGPVGGDGRGYQGRGLRCPGSGSGVRRPKEKWRFIYILPRLGQWADACPRARPAARSAEAVPKMAAARGGVAGAVQ